MTFLFLPNIEYGTEYILNVSILDTDVILYGDFNKYLLNVGDTFIYVDLNFLTEGLYIYPYTYGSLNLFSVLPYVTLYGANIFITITAKWTLE